jgi:predicted dienelactone hydrolase
MPRSPFRRLCPPLALAALLLALGSAPPAEAGRSRGALPGVIGAFGVGHEELEWVDAERDDRPLRTEVWYPTSPNAMGTRTFYDFRVFGLGLRSEIAHDGVAPSPFRRFPLVIFSHGSGGVSWQSIPLMEALASHGFVVAAPNHSGNTVYDQLNGTSQPFPQVAADRPLDVSFVIDAMLARNDDPLDPLFGKIDPERIGVAGHSFGGYTALVIAGGFAGLGVVPDPRVRAIAAIAPASSFLSDDDLAAIEVPMFLLSGSFDTTTPIEPNTRRPWELATGRPVYRADVQGGTHEHFAAVCAIGDVLATLGLSDEAIDDLVVGFLDTCRPPALDPEEVERIQSTYLVAFFQRHLAGNELTGLWLHELWNLLMEPLVEYDVAPVVEAAR